MLSQFTREAAGQLCLADLDFIFPRDAYPIGRLDADSEGLLVLTNDKSLNIKLLNPKNHVEKTYWVQVEGIPTEAALEHLRKGVAIRVDGKIYHTLPAVVNMPDTAPIFPDRIPPVRFRKTVPDSWLEIRIHEGKNRQVRRMCAAVGFPVLRLIRSGFGKLSLGDMLPGAVREIPEYPI